jgi:hypothetical protein
MVTDVLIEPLQFDLEFLRAEPDRAKNAETAGVRHGGGHIAAVGESEDGEFDPKAFAKLVVHGMTLLLDDCLIVCVQTLHPGVRPMPEHPRAELEQILLLTA